jgi:hypothetical protein
MPTLDRARVVRDAVIFLGHYRSGELDVRIRRAGIGSASIYARVSMLDIEQHFAGGEEGAVLEIDDVEGQHVVTFTAYYSRQELELVIRRKYMPLCRESARIALDGLVEFFRWCNRAAQIFSKGGKKCGFDAEELAQLCGVKPESSGLKVNAFEGLELTRVDGAEAEADADARQQRMP